MRDEGMSRYLNKNARKNELEAVMLQTEGPELSLFAGPVLR